METSKEREEQFMQNESPNAYALYQLVKGPSTRYHRFEAYDALKKHGLSVERKNYECVYSSVLAEPAERTAEKLAALYRLFNLYHPLDYTGQSASVSDIFAIRENGKTVFYYVDTIGFKEVPEFEN